MIDKHNKIHHVMNASGCLQFDNDADSDLCVTAFGDLAFHDKVSYFMKANTPDMIFDGVRDHIISESIKIGNLESVIVSQPSSKESKKALLVSDTSAVNALKSIDIDMLSFANNHVKDADASGVVDSIKIITESGIRIYGAGCSLLEARRPAIIERNNIKLIAFAYADGMGQIATGKTAGCAEAKLENILEDIKPYSNVDGAFIIVSLHMDAEFQETPSPKRIELCRCLADAGVHIVLCHHPHVIQGIERWNDSLIVYSLGNYVTTITPYLLAHSDMTHKSYHINIRLNKRGIKNIEVIPILIDSDGRPHVANGNNKCDILGIIAHRSELLINDKIINDNYTKMINEWIKNTLMTILWAIRNRDVTVIKSVMSEIIKTKTKRLWIVDFCQSIIR